MYIRTVSLICYQICIVEALSGERSTCYVIVPTGLYATRRYGLLRYAEMLRQRSAAAEGARKRAVEVARLKRLIRGRGGTLGRRGRGRVC